ncbi:hypothetical protein P8C59_004085 [Phyllachora maydis]|uniref:Ubiquitin-like modifier-activating enzyme ATG7 n=1 Tax=Phyllachora maydis TaxID=1825666 RepID=A0AAD9I1W1_9PEZI|nr:hypothetical protein P8C59_004085 [Phyllachora maydis]
MDWARHYSLSSPEEQCQSKQLAPGSRALAMDLKFVPFSSEIELPFYAALFASKLDTDKLDDSSRPVIGLYEPRATVEPASGTRLQIHGNALTSHHVPLGMSRAEGFIKNVNTVEDFKNTDKPAMLNKAAQQIWDAIQDGTIYSVPSLLSSFTVLSYADLKKYRFTYWFAFPALHSDPQWKRIGPVSRLSPQESTTLVEKVGTWRYTIDNREHGFFLVKKVRIDPEDIATASSITDDNVVELGFKWAVGSLRDFEKGFFKEILEKDRYIAFVDPSNYEGNPSWPLRNLLVLIRQRYRLDTVQILCYRDMHAKRHEARSIILQLAMDKVENMSILKMPKVTGWERNTNGDLKARIANLAEYMDPSSLADQAVDLNLKLMKWRISPSLNLDMIKGTKCLLLGAGTLGSYVSRNLMGWGVRKITFVDYGSVSFSNPVRQPLFEFGDCLNGGKPKALQAAEALKKIYPGVDAEGHVLSVPMLGHPMIDEVKTRAEFAKLQKLVEAHDVIFLLMDSRESRWLPTVMGKATGKILINAALGFDTYVVMRHGQAPTDEAPETVGCYFCNDVVIAGNSMKDQTLDQQCTVTRPGVAAIASALAVELLIRGFLETFQNMLINGKAYPQCSGCSEPVVAAYAHDPWGFLKEALENRNYVAELSGLAEVQRKAEAAAEEVDWSDDGADGEANEVEGERSLLHRSRLAPTLSADAYLPPYRSSRKMARLAGYLFYVDVLLLSPPLERT